MFVRMTVPQFVPQTQAVLAASTGATLAELMGRLGHSTPTAAIGTESHIVRRHNLAWPCHARDLLSRYSPR